MQIYEFYWMVIRFLFECIDPSNRFLRCKRSQILSSRNLGLFSTTLNSFAVWFEMLKLKEQAW